MERILIIDGHFSVPEKHRLSKDKRRLMVKTPWGVQIETLDKQCWQTTIQRWNRSKSRGDKPYIPEGFIEIDGERYEAYEPIKKTNKCPKCGADTYLRQESSSGEYLELCSRCDWVEDLTQKPKKEKGGEKDDNE